MAKKRNSLGKPAEKAYNCIIEKCNFELKNRFFLKRYVIIFLSNAKGFLLTQIEQCNCFLKGNFAIKETFNLAESNSIHAR